MRKVAAIVLVAMLGLVVLAVLFSVAGADRSLYFTRSQRTPIRAYVGGTVQQYDTLGLRVGTPTGEGERVELQSFSIFADDSAQTPTLWVNFVSSISKTSYLKLTQAFTANQVLEKTWTGTWVFPKDSVILVYYNILGATPGTLDTLIAHATYRIEKP